VVVDCVDAVWSKNSKRPIFKDLPGDQEVARRPLPQLILLDELETNAGVSRLGSG
jgi:hypothetical protein